MEVETSSNKGSTLNPILEAILLGFKYVKNIYANDDDFARVFVKFEKSSSQENYIHDGFLSKENRNFVPKCFMHNLIMQFDGKEKDNANMHEHLKKIELCDGCD